MNTHICIAHREAYYIYFPYTMHAPTSALMQDEKGRFDRMPSLVLAYSTTLHQRYCLPWFRFSLILLNCHRHSPPQLKAPVPSWLPLIISIKLLLGSVNVHVHTSSTLNSIHVAMKKCVCMWNVSATIGDLNQRAWECWAFEDRVLEVVWMFSQRVWFIFLDF